MLWIKCVDNDVVRAYVGDFNYVKKLAQYTISLHADGDELEHITRTITGIPLSKGRVQHWFGDTAKFIAANL
jgi:hypothetical protein